MAIRFYIVPTEIVPHPDHVEGELRPQHIPTTVTRNFKQYGGSDCGLVAADVSVGQHTTIVGNATAESMPEDLDELFDTTALVALLDSLDVPTHWIAANDTGRNVIPGLLGIFLFNRRFMGRAQVNIVAGALDTTLGSLQVQVREGFESTGETFRNILSRTGITDSTTIGEALFMYGQRYMAQRHKPIVMLGVEF